MEGTTIVTAAAASRRVNDDREPTMRDASPARIKPRAPWRSKLHNFSKKTWPNSKVAPGAREKGVWRRTLREKMPHQEDVQ